MDTISNLMLGFQVLLTIETLCLCLFGVTVGMLIGVLPGIGSMAAISMLMPLTFYLEPSQALIMLAGIYYGAQYGNSITSILLNVPGTPSSAVTALDGYPLCKQERRGQQSSSQLSPLFWELFCHSLPCSIYAGNCQTCSELRLH